jgi:hypothetical protein
MMSFLTGMPEVDVKTFLELDDRTLSSICQTSSYANTVCNDEYFWSLKIERLGLPVVKCQGCNTFKESYFNYVKYLNNHGFILIIGEKGWYKYYIFSNITDAYEFYIQSLMKYSALKTDEPNIFPPLNQASNLINLYQNTLTLKYDSIFLGLYFFEFGAPFALNNALLIINNDEEYGIYIQDSIIINNADMYIQKDLSKFLPFHFNIPYNIVIAFWGYTNDNNQEYVIFKEYDSLILNHAQKEYQDHNSILWFRDFDTQTQTAVSHYVYNGILNNFLETQIL